MSEISRHELRVYYEDTDASGVAYHANYLRWFERARTEWLRERGVSQERLRLELGIAFTIADLSVRYRRPARLDDALEVRTRITARKRASLEFAQQLFHAAAPEELLAEMELRVACVDVTNFRPKGLPSQAF